MLGFLFMVTFMAQLGLLLAVIYVHSQWFAYYLVNSIQCFPKYDPHLLQESLNVFHDF